VEAEAPAVEAGVVDAEESTVEAEAPVKEAGALLDGAGSRGGGGRGGEGRGGAGLGVVEDRALLDRASVGASKRRRRTDTDGGVEVRGEAEAGGRRAVHAGGG
jgi:hypothetical protein